MNVSKQRLLIVLSFFVVVLTVSVSLVFPGLWIVLLPILGIAFLLAALGYEISSWTRRSKSPDLQSRIRILVLTSLLVVSSTGLALSRDVIWVTYKDVAHVSNQFRRINSLRDPESFRDAAIEFHSELMSLDRDQWLIQGDSERIPPEIRAVQPVSIHASEHYLSLKMTSTGDSVAVIYSPESSKGRVSAYKVCNDFYYWDADDKLPVHVRGQ